MRFEMLARAALLGAGLAACGDGDFAVGGAGGTSAVTSGKGPATGTATVGPSSTQATSVASGAGGGPPGQVPGIVAVGYGGIRVVSRDEGLTWGDRASSRENGGDDEFLLRAVVWGEGLWIATGWHYFTSSDGVAWTDHGKISDTGILPCNIVEGLAFYDGAYWAACPSYLPGFQSAQSAVYRSVDGITWGAAVGMIGETDTTTQGHLYLTTAGGQLVAWGDSGRTYTSTDGVTWSEVPGIEAGIDCEGELESMVECDASAVTQNGRNTYYDGVSYFSGVWLKGKWQGIISRSTDGVAYDDVYTDDELNTPYRGTAFARGYVAR